MSVTLLETSSFYQLFCNKLIQDKYRSLSLHSVGARGQGQLGPVDGPEKTSNTQNWCPHKNSKYCESVRTFFDRNYYVIWYLEPFGGTS